MHGQMIEPQEAKQSISSLATVFLTGSPPDGVPSNHQRIGQLIAGFSKLEIRDPAYVRAQQALRESVSRFRSLIENAELIAIKLNEEGDLTYCNKFFLQFTGWRREEVLGRSWCDLFIPPGQYSSELYKAQIATGFVFEQWDSEILKHCRSGLRVLVLKSKTALPQARALASNYDASTVISGDCHSANVPLQIVLMSHLSV